MKKAFTNRRMTATLQGVNPDEGNIWLVTALVNHRNNGTKRHCWRIAIPAKAGKKQSRAAIRRMMSTPLNSVSAELAAELAKPHWYTLAVQVIANPTAVYRTGQRATPIDTSARIKRKAAALKAARQDAEQARQRRAEQDARAEAAAQAERRRANDPDLIARRIHEQQQLEHAKAAAQRRHIERNQGECGFALLELVDEYGLPGVKFTPAQFAAIAISRGLIAESSRAAMTALALRNLPQIAPAAL